MPYLTSKPIRRGTKYEKTQLDFIVTEPIKCGDNEYVLENGIWIDSNGETAPLKAQEFVQEKLMKLFRECHTEYDTSYITLHFIEDYQSNKTIKARKIMHTDDRIRRFREAQEIAIKDRACGTRNRTFFGTYNKGFTPFEQELFFEGYGSRE